MDKKNIDLKAFAIQVKVLELATYASFPKWWDNLPEDSNGPEITKDQALKIMSDGLEWFKLRIAEDGLSLPEVSDNDLPDIEPEFPVDPVGNVKTLTITKTGTISIDGLNRDKFVFPKLGPEYGKKFRFVFSNGNTMDIVDSTKGFELNNRHHKYQPGYTYSYNPPNPDIPTMEVYLKYGASADSVTLHYLEDVEVDPPEPISDGEDTGEVVDGGSNEIVIRNTGAKMSWNSYWYDKFVFPKCGPEYTSESFRIVYADGNELSVHNPAEMTMTPDNMKYQPGGRWSHNNPDIPTMEVYARRDTHPAWVKAIFRHPVR